MKGKVPIIVISIILIGVFVFFYYQYSVRNKRHNWIESYRESSESPYGLAVLKQLLKEYMPDNRFIESRYAVANGIPTNPDTTSSYFFVGENIYLSYEDIDTLAEFIRNGNTAFFSIKEFPYNMVDLFDDGYCVSHEWEISEDINLNFSAPNYSKTEGYPYTFQAWGDTTKYRWFYYDVADCSSSINILGYQSGDEYYANFIELKYGQGQLYLHASPITFTNFHLIREEGVEYTEKVLSYLPEGNVYFEIGSRIASKNPQQPQRAGKNALSYILSQPSLKWAFYLILIMAVLYLIFYSKRRQKPIPVLAPNENTSIEFTETIGRLYFQQNNHKKLVEMKVKHFKEFIKDRYNLHQHNDQQQLIQKLSGKSGFDVASIQKIFDTFEKLEKRLNVVAEDVIDLHQQLEYFYHNCK